MIGPPPRLGGKIIKSKRAWIIATEDTLWEVQKNYWTALVEFFADTVLMMHKLSREAMREGRLISNRQRQSFKFDEHGKPTESLKKPRLDSHRLIEEFMLLETKPLRSYGLQKRKNIQPLYLPHPWFPDGDKLKDLARFGWASRLQFHIGGGCRHPRRWTAP